MWRKEEITCPPAKTATGSTESTTSTESTLLFFFLLWANQLRLLFLLCGDVAVSVLSPWKRQKKKKTQDFPPAPPLGSLSSRRVSYAQDLEVAGHWTMIASNSVCCCRWVNLTGLHLLTILSLSACPSLLRDWFRARSRNKHDFYLLHSMEVEMSALHMLCCCQNFFTEQQTHFLLLLSDILPLSP